MAFLVVCISSLLIISISSYVFQLLSDRRSRFPPGPRPLPFIGNLLGVVGELPHRSLARLAGRHGSLMTVRLGTLLTIVASSPSAAREILQTHNGSLTGRSPPDAWLALGHAANSVFVLPPCRRWRALRRIGTEHLLSARQLDGNNRLRPLLREAVLDLLRRVSGMAEAGPTVEVGRASFAVMMDLQWRAMFSVGLDDAAEGALHDAAHEAVAVSLKPNVSDFFPALAAADLQGVRRRFGRRVAVVYRMIDEQIERRMRGRREAGGGRSSGEKDLLDVMLDMSSEHGKDEDGAISLLQDIFLATVDTIASTIEWAMAELLQHPDTMSKLQEEIRKVLGSKGHVECSDINRLPYLQAVVRETLRLHPVTVEIQGYTVPKGCTVLVNLWAVHRDAKAWPEPEKFKPERFLPRLEETGFLGTTEFNFIPFSAGRRVCLGLPLATRMVHAMLGSLIHRFELTLPQEVKENGVDISESLGLTMIMAKPLQAIAKSV
ncbi:hypothetical protein HU200_060317 [Digitaria exilis]|uniref:Cytochrome P450 n=1 Tax=Digitaria exilis TaxID=1010633 RepID=A0A835DXL0_9POAL|nr:hypothetical protein HU200_060317 [Digitaria exilis]